MSEASKNQLNYKRSQGVARAWNRERELVRSGRGTREWSVSEQKQLLDTGRVQGYQGHHMMSVSKYPEHADNPKNIQFLDTRKGNNEHLKAHKNDYREASEGRYNVKTGKIRPMKDGKVRAMNAYELKDKAVEKRGYKKYAADKTLKGASPAQMHSRGEQRERMSDCMAAEKKSPVQRYVGTAERMNSRAHAKEGGGMRNGARTTSTSAMHTVSGRGQSSARGGHKR